MAKEMRKEPSIPHNFTFNLLFSNNKLKINDPNINNNQINEYGVFDHDGFKINDRDIAEINGFWAYQNTRNKEFTVNGKTFKVIDSYDDASTSNSQGASDSKLLNY